MKPYRIVCFSILFLLVVSGFGSTTSLSTVGESHTSNILYVGGSGPGNYSIIQDAIDNASNGDTVYVYHGTYRYLSPETDFIHITKEINLTGENKFNTILVGIDNTVVLEVHASGVRISGFTIRNGGDSEPGGEWGVAIAIVYRHQNIRIYDNIITGNYYGIETYDNVTDVFIYDNTISENYVGIQCIEGFSSFVQIYNNTISNNTAEGLSVSLHNSSIYNNIISNNARGVVLIGGDAACSMSHNQIQDNDIGVQVVNARYTIQKNNFIHNTKQVANQKSVRLIELPRLPLYRQKWDNNYWDEWKKPTPRPISGSGIIYFRYYIPNWYIDYPIAFFIFLEFDWHPTQEPYDIDSDA